MTDAERLQAVITHAKKNRNNFGASIGLKRSTKIYAILNGEYGISADLAKSITDIYKEISYDWLLNDKGEMLIDEFLKISRPKPVEREFPHTLEACLRRLEELERDNEKLWDQIKWQNNRIDFLLAKLLEAKEIKPEKSNNK